MASGGRVTARRLRTALEGLPSLTGEPIAVEFHRVMRVHRRHLWLGGSEGSEIHAASSIRERRILLASSLSRNPAELTRILVHEIFHFAWVRLSNGIRLSYEAALAEEMARGVSGELGWSAESRKNRLHEGDVAGRSRSWREYVCESFCDTAAWHYSGVVAHDEFTLPKRCQSRRARWFRNFCEPGGRIAI